MSLELRCVENLSKRISLGIVNRRLLIALLIALIIITIDGFLFYYQSNLLHLALSLETTIVSFIIFIIQLAGMPRLKILFSQNSNDKPGKWYVDVFNIHDEGVYYCKKGFLRVRVINLGASTIRNCEAKILV